jgi:HK97 family phage portal protein
MGILSRAYERKMTSDQLWTEIYGGRKSSSGRIVNLETAISVSAVFACCRVIGNGMAQIPLKLMGESDNGKTRLPVKDNQLYQLLAVRPNRWQTSFEWRQMMSWHIELAGAHYSYINRQAGRIVELFPFQPGQVQVIELGKGEVEYKVTLPKAEPLFIKAADMLHIKGPTWDGVNGIDVVRIAREAIGLSIASQESASTLHKNSVNASGIYSVDGTLKADQHKSLTEWIDEHYAGPENFGKPLILDRAAKWVSTQMTNVDAQALETRKYQIEEVCRFFGVMPIMAGYSDKTATYASAEQMFLAHLVHTMAPRWAAVEQALDAQLLSEKEREQGLYFDFVEEGMIRGSSRDTKNVLLGYVNGGLMTPNEGRAKLDLNPDPDPNSDKLRVPINITGKTPGDESEDDSNQ